MRLQALSVTLLFFLILNGPQARGASGQAPLKILIDVGHGLSAGGATSARGEPEFHFNQRIADLLAKRLALTGRFQPIIINRDGKIGSLQARVTETQNTRADLFISIHHDSVQEKYLRPWVHDGKKKRYSDHFNGYSIFYSERNAQPKRSWQLAETLAAFLHRAGFAHTLHHAEPIKGENRPLINKVTGVYRFDGLYVLRKNNIPAVLLECGVILNRAEEARLNDPNYRLRFTDAIVEGLLSFHASR